MKRNNDGFASFEEIIIVFLVILFTFAMIVGKIDLIREETQHKEVIMDLFNGQEVKIEGWMFDFKNIKEVADEWCLKHNIPEDQRSAKVRELVDRYNHTLSISFITLKPLPIESGQNP